MTEKAPYLSVVIPAYNEAERIPGTLLDIDHKLHDAPFTYEILVVNDGSKDNTATVVRKLSQAVKNVVLIDNEINKGKGGVVKQGMLEAKGEIRLFMDADNSTSVDQFLNMKPLFEQGADIVIGSRAIKGARLEPAEPLIRQIPGKLGNILIQVTNLPGIWDTQCGFKAFTAKATKDIFPGIKTHGWGFDIEILALGRAMGYKIKEIPVRWVNAAGSKVGISAYLKVFSENFKIRWWFLTGKYGVSRRLPVF
jgi:dolichyl-phosphate beta-glucosyltransferase